MAVPAPESLRAAEKCTMGCPIVDACLGGGGVPCNSVTEIVAESGSGKTQLCLQLCLAAQLPHSLGGLNASSLFLHTEFPFPSRRLHKLSLTFRHRHATLFSDPLDNVFVRAVHSAHQLLDEMPKIASFISGCSSALPVRILVLDSIAALFRSEFDNTSVDLKRRSSLLFKISGELRRLAKRFELAVVVTNQVVDYIGESSGANVSALKIGNLRCLYSSGRRVCPALGLAWANCVNSRLFLSRDDEVVGEETTGSSDADRVYSVTTRTRRRLHVLFAPHLGESSVEFMITREGVSGVN